MSALFAIAVAAGTPSPTPTTINQLMNRVPDLLDRPVRVCGERNAWSDTILYDRTGRPDWGIYIDRELMKGRRPGERFCVDALFLRIDGVSASTARTRGLSIAYASHGPWGYALRSLRYATVDECCRAFDPR